MRLQAIRTDRPGRPPETQDRRGPHAAATGVGWLRTLPWIEAEVVVGPPIFNPFVSLFLFSQDGFFASDALPGDLDFEQLDPELSELTLRGSPASGSFLIQGRLLGIVRLPELLVLSPELSVNAVDTEHTLSALLWDDFSPRPDVGIEFRVESGPNAGLVAPGPGTVCSLDFACRTDPDGMTSFTYPGLHGPGVDRIVGGYVDPDIGFVEAAPVLKFWDADCDRNRVPDTCDLDCAGFDGLCASHPACGDAEDANGDGVPDACNLPPDCTNAGAEPAELWPPYHALKEVAVAGVTDEDGEPVAIEVTSIFQDEPVAGEGDGGNAPDADGIGAATARVRAERSGSGDGRVYRIAFHAFDAEGAACDGEVTVCVPHDRLPGRSCGDQGPLFDSSVDAGGASARGCGLGLELAALAPLLARLTRRRRPPR